MMLFYCPECNREQILGANNPYINEKTIINLRDGYGRPIVHYKCECGNYLAGSMDITGLDEHKVQYCKNIIREYNKNGCFYHDNLTLSGDSCDLFESAKQCYEDRKKKYKEK